MITLIFVAMAIFALAHSLDNDVVWAIAIVAIWILFVAAEAVYTILKEKIQTLEAKTKYLDQPCRSVHNEDIPKEDIPKDAHEEGVTQRGMLAQMGLDGKGPYRCPACEGYLYRGQPFCDECGAKIEWERDGIGKKEYIVSSLRGTEKNG